MPEPFKKYTSETLVRYEDTIVLHFDPKGETAWLTLKNYGGVFDEESPDKVTEAVVGTKADEEFKETISIGAMLDVADVIIFQQRIQRMIVAETVTTKQQTLSREQACKGIARTLKYVGVADPSLKYEKDDPNFWHSTFQQLKIKLKELGWLLPPKGKFSGLSISYAIHKYGKFGFTAYFPKPSLILQEERTALQLDNDGKQPSGNGKTINQDIRFIKPILSKMRVPPKFTFSEYIKDLDKDEFVGSATGNNPLRLSSEERAQKAKEKANRKKVGGYLHGHLERICCFGFRGDDRDPETMKRANGFLPGVTRKDAKQYSKNVAKRLLDPNEKVTTRDVSEVAATIDRTVGYVESYVVMEEQPDGQTIPVVKKRGGKNLLRSWRLAKEYQDTMKDVYILDLGVYTGDLQFKGFISVTKSTAIAKHFANAWAEENGVRTFCYAVRCRGGFHLPSYVKASEVAKAKPGWEKHVIENQLKAQHLMTTFAEQEVAVAGAIWWEDVVGVRVIQCNEKGQFFCGPIFLQDHLRQEHLDEVKEKRREFPRQGVQGRADTTLFLAVSPGTAIVAPGHRQQFTVTGKGASNGVVWSVDGVPGGNDSVGTISADGNFKASREPHWATVTASAFATEENWEFHPTARVIKKFSDATMSEKYYSARAALNVTRYLPMDGGNRVKAWFPKPENSAFGALFELFSGKSQGKGYKIEKSYEKAPWYEKRQAIED